MAAENESKCQGCGKRIVWATTAEGKKIPLDPTAPVYQVASSNVTGTIGCCISPLYNDTDAKVRLRQHMVSHFATCPKANQF